MPTYIALSLEIDNEPDVLLTVQRHEGCEDWQFGTLWQTESMVEGFSFCHYEPGTPEHDNWVMGYQSCTYNGNLLSDQVQRNEQSLRS